MAKEIDILSYWMPVLRKIKEFREIAKTEEPELRYLLEACDKTLDNMFILTTDEYGIARYEAMMGIYPEEGADLESRRFNVLVKLNDKVPYTKKTFEDTFTSLLGDNKYEIITDYKNYTVTIITEIENMEIFDLLIEAVKKIVPCNMVTVIENDIKVNIADRLHFSGISSVLEEVVVTNDINEIVMCKNPNFYSITPTIVEDIKT